MTEHDITHPTSSSVGCICGWSTEVPLGHSVTDAFLDQHIAPTADFADMGYAPRQEQGVMTSDSVRPVPNKPKTPIRSFRIPDVIYLAAQAKAAEKGETLTEVVRRALERYAKRG